MGRPVEAPGFRAYGAPDPLQEGSGKGRSRATRWLTTLTVLAVLLGIGFAAQQLGLNPLAGPGAAAAKLSNEPTPGFEEGSSPVGTPPPTTDLSSVSYRFAMTQPDGVSPVTWSPRRPIHYVVHPLNQPQRGPAAVAQAISAASAATGLTFIDDGPTDEAPTGSREPYLQDRYGDRLAPVLIVWATPDEVPDFGIDVAGEADATRVTTPSGGTAYVGGIVYLDPAKYLVIASRRGQADPGQLMWPRGNTAGLTAFQPGDLAGLNALGRGPCRLTSSWAAQLTRRQEASEAHVEPLAVWSF